MKKHCKLSILFWLWKSKVKEGERAPIYARLTIDNQDVEMSTSKKILPEFWDSDSKTVKGKSVEAKKINSHLREIDLERLYNILQANYDQIDPNLLKLLYKNPFGSKTNSEEPTILEEVQLINFLEQLIDTSRHLKYW